MTVLKSVSDPDQRHRRFLEQTGLQPFSVQAVLPNGDALSSGIAAAARFAQASGLTQTVEARLCILVEEIIANLMEHGDLLPRVASELILSIDVEGSVRIVVCDSGTAFDLRVAQVATPNLTRGGGAGLAIIRA